MTVGNEFIGREFLQYRPVGFRLAQLLLLCVIV
jgi:hypothetical protein